MKKSKIILVLLMMFFCVGVLAPPASALDRDPNQPRVDERLPEGDDDPWGEADNVSDGPLDEQKSITSDNTQDLFDFIWDTAIIYINKTLHLYKVEGETVSANEIRK